VDRTKSKATSSTSQHAPQERVAFSIAAFCARNDISLPTYYRLRRQKRGPKEMRLGLNIIRITGEAEREWQHARQEEPRPDLEDRTMKRAVVAGDAAAKSPKHISQIRRARSAALKHCNTSPEEAMPGNAGVKSPRSVSERRSQSQHDTDG
jgi:hypothetical protein